MVPAQKLVRPCFRTQKSSGYCKCHSASSMAALPPWCQMTLYNTFFSFGYESKHLLFCIGPHYSCKLSRFGYQGELAVLNVMAWDIWCNELRTTFLLPLLIVARFVSMKAEKQYNSQANDARCMLQQCPKHSKRLSKQPCVHNWD